MDAMKNDLVESTSFSEKDLADRLLEKRTRLGLKRTELAKIIGCSSSSIGAWEDGINKPKGDLAAKVNEWLDA